MRQSTAKDLVYGCVSIVRKCHESLHKPLRIPATLRRGSPGLRAQLFLHDKRAGINDESGLDLRRYRCFGMIGQRGRVRVSSSEPIFPSRPR
jgi:hypothetical protein